MTREQTITVHSTLQLYKGNHLEENLLLIDSMKSLPFPKEPKRMNCLLIAICLEGTSSYTVDTIQYTVHPNELLIISPGQVTDNYHIQQNFKAFGIMIAEDFFQDTITSIREVSSLFLFSKNHPVCLLQPEEVNMMTTYFQLLKEKLKNKDHLFLNEMIKSLCKTIIYDLSNAFYRIQKLEETSHQRSKIIFQQFIKLVERNFKEERRVAWYAQQLNISAKYLSETIKQSSNRTPNEWIDYYVVLELRVLFKNTSKSIKEITKIMHFANQSFLGRYFKEHVGMSPSDYRKSNR